MTQYLRDLSALSKNEIAAFLASFDTVLSDCDGVLWYADKQLQRSLDVINSFKALGKKVFLVSNNCTTTIEDYLTKTKNFGLDVKQDEIIIPSIMASSYLTDQDFKKKAFILASSPFKEELKLHGIHCSSDVGPDYALRSLDDLKDELARTDKDVGAVVIDFDMNINYIKMMKAYIHLRKPDCLFVVGASDPCMPVRENFHMIGPGNFISTLEFMTGRKPVVLGKPSPLIKDFISKRYPINPERTLMIGDSLTLDIQLGTNCGFQKLLVLSGISKLEDAAKDSTNLPDYYIKTLGDLLPLLPSAVGE